LKDETRVSAIDKFGYKVNNWSKVYFLQGENGGPIKIGHTNDIEKRIKLMQTGNPDKLVLLHLTSGGKNFEDQLHVRFSEFHYRGEWFYPSEEILDFISELKIKDEKEPHIPTIVEFALAWGESLTTDEKKLLQEIVNGVNLDPHFNWDRYLGILADYKDYLEDPEKFTEKYKDYYMK
jgi:hypothetical protein